MTVRGPIPASKLGFVLPHEHPYCKLRQARHRYDFPDQYSDETTVRAEAQAFRDLGGGTIVDLTVPHIGRDPERLVALSEATGLHIVMGCGWYRESYYQPEDRLDRRPVGDLVDELLSEIEDGVGPGRVRPGVLGEMGSEKTWVSPVEERVLRAAARVQRQTGLALGAVHSIGPVGPWQVDIIEEEGADLTRVAIAHCETNPYFDYLVGLLRRGVYVVFDNCGQYRAMGQFEDQILRLICDLLDAGYGDCILLSQDTCKFGQFRCHGGPGFTYVADTFVPRLRELGVPEESVSAMTNANPQRWLAGTGS